MRTRYSGPTSFDRKKAAEDLGEWNTVFMENCSDLFAAAVPDAMIRKVLAHCRRYPKNTYLFHTKNPARFADYLAAMPPKRILGVTAETNRPTPTISLAPSPMARLAAFGGLPGSKLITIEPIMDFDLAPFGAALLAAKPDFVIVGADSKGTTLPEPPKAKILALLALLRKAKVRVDRKTNLARLLK
jgi:protein gp37